MKDNKPNSNVISIHKNISSQKTYGANQPKIVDYESYEESVMDILACVNDEKDNPQSVMSGVTTLKNLFLIDVPQTFRPSLFRQLNSLVSSLMISYSTHREVYDRVFAMMTAFKNQIDQASQQNEDLAEIEWEEMQKVVYLLTDWEDAVNSDQTVGVMGSTEWARAGTQMASCQLFF